MNTSQQQAGIETARLLIVDDEAPQMRALCDTLEDQGYSVAGYTSASAALGALREGSYDLVLTDLMMPEMDGIALLKSALEIDPQLVGIVMTGFGTIDTAVRAMQVGALDYILKPFKLSSILPVLTRALAVRRLRLENAELQERVRARTAELEAANAELEGFARSVSHDLRAPLRAIGGFAMILNQDFEQEMPEEAQKLLKSITANAQRMERLIEDLLRFARLGRQPLYLRPMSMSALVQEALLEVQADAPGRKVDLRVQDLPDAIGDSSLLKQVLINLLSNAYKFTRGREPAIIEIGSYEQDGDVVYFVRDNGAGFDMRFVDKLFGVFQRLHAADQFEGTGVGLSLCSRILQRHGGRIWAIGEPGKGATFHFVLPSAQPGVDVDIANPMP